MDRARLTGWIAVLLVAAALMAVPGCSSPSVEAPQAAELEAALSTASTSVADASTYIIGLKQDLPNAPSNDDLEKLQTTLNAAETQTGAVQRATAQSALDQFNAGIAEVTPVYEAAPADGGDKEQLRQLIATLEVGRDALDEALK